MSTPITMLLAQAHDGDTDAWDRIYHQLYPELRRIARAMLCTRNRQQSATSLVSEGWLKLVNAPVTAQRTGPSWPH